MIEIKINVSKKDCESLHIISKKRKCDVSEVVRKAIEKQIAFENIYKVV